MFSKDLERQKNTFNNIFPLKHNLVMILRCYRDVVTLCTVYAITKKKETVFFIIDTIKMFLLDFLIPIINRIILFFII